MKLDKNSYGSIAIAWAVGVTLIFLVFKFIPMTFACWAIIAVLIWFICFVTCFFRVPERKSAGSDKIVTSSADGKVVIIGKAFENEYLKRECIQVSVYMNFFDVHANFWPVTGTVTYFKYHPGAHILVIKPKASEENEHTCTCIRTPEGKEVFFKQIAGGFARRIVNYAQPGLKVKAGEQCGIIKFGSRMDFFLPLDADIKVRIGDYARAAETVIALI